MTKIEELEQKIETINIVLENLKLELENYEKALAELKESKKEGKWKPKEGEKYWFVSCYAKSDFGFWKNDSIDIWRYKTMPLFEEKQECERYKHFMDTVKEKSYEFSDLEWQDEYRHKYIIGYDFKEKCFYVDSLTIRKYLGEIHFKSREDAQYIIDNFKDELMEFFV